ncbi:MAG: DksA/TraR family C4-type zinc finger protein [Myxococcota bacterium]
MAGGWTRDGAVQDQIDASVEDAVERARAALSAGEGRTHCMDCEAPIPERRRQLVPGVLRCVACQQEEDAAQKSHALFNRRGSKDSQLK